jgi:hypothetical protein
MARLVLALVAALSVSTSAYAETPKISGHLGSSAAPSSSGPAGRIFFGTAALCWSRATRRWQVACGQMLAILPAPVARRCKARSTDPGSSANFRHD